MKTTNHRLTLTTATLLGAVFTLGHISPLAAAENYFKSTTGSWNTAGNWVSGYVPSQSASTGTAVIGGAYTGTAMLNSGTGTAIVVQVGKSLSSNSRLQVGGSGVLTGVRTIALGGIEGTATGVLEIRDNALVSSTTTIVGHTSGRGTLMLDGGTLRTDTLTIGLNAGSNGVLEIGREGTGQIVKMDGTATTITGGSGTGMLNFAHSGHIDFDNPIAAPNIQLVQRGFGATTLTADSIQVRTFSVINGRMNLSAGTTLTVSGTSSVVGPVSSLGGEGHITGGRLTVQGTGRLATTLTLSGGLTLSSGAVLDYADEGLLLNGGILTINNGGIVIDFSNSTLGSQPYLIMDYANTTGNNVLADGSQFIATGLDPDITGSFSVVNNQLFFNATAVPEPSLYFLLGAGLGVLLISRLRNRKSQTQD
jgi:hypothetical protein